MPLPFITASVLVGPVLCLTTFLRETTVLIPAELPLPSSRLSPIFLPWLVLVTVPVLGTSPRRGRLMIPLKHPLILTHVSSVVLPLLYLAVVLIIVASPLLRDDRSADGHEQPRRN